MHQAPRHNEHTALTRFKHGQVTLPASISEEFSLEDEDLLEVSRQGNSILLTPKEVIEEPDPNLEAMLAERLAEVRQGKATPAFENMDAFEAWDSTHPE